MTNQEIKDTGLLIKNEQQIGGNTALRVGGVIEGIGYALDNKDAANGYYQATINGGSISVNATNYVLGTGGNLRIKMPAAGTTASTLTIGNANAVQLWYNGAAVSAQNTWEQGEIISVFYDGTRFMASNSQGGGGKAEKISYNNSQSGLTANNVQGAIDEASAELAELGEELNSRLNDYEEISWTSVPLHNGWINDSQNWASRSNTRYRVWPVAEGEVYKLTTNSVGAIQPAWLASYNYSSDPISGSPDFAPNYAGKLPQQAINTTKEYIVPSGAHFLYILYYVNGSNRTPSYFGKKYNKIDALAERVSANEYALQNINVENLDFSGDVTNDFVLSDENNFDIAQFRKGHIFTKNFASDKMKIAAYLQNRCSGKICAIVGDSISSYDGQAPSGYAHYYPQGNVNNVNATWWKITCDILGMTPVNCAWSGSKTIGAPKGATAVAGCSDQRITDCGRNGTPDIIIFYMGTNDFGSEVALGNWNINTAIIDDSEYTPSQQISNFRDAYALMLKKARVAFPDAKIYCCTLIDTVTLDSNAGWPSNNGNGVTIHTWNENIKEIAEALGCSVIDLHSCGLHFFNIENHSVDATKGKVPGLHPDSWGHIQIAAKVITHLISE